MSSLWTVVPVYKLSTVSLQIVNCQSMNCSISLQIVNCQSTNCQLSVYKLSTVSLWTVVSVYKLSTVSLWTFKCQSINCQISVHKINLWKNVYAVKHESMKNIKIKTQIHEFNYQSIICQELNLESCSQDLSFVCCHSRSVLTQKIKFKNSGFKTDCQLSTQMQIWDTFLIFQLSTQRKMELLADTTQGLKSLLCWTLAQT